MMKQISDWTIGKNIVLLILSLVVCMSVMAQKADYSKMSSLVREAVHTAYSIEQENGTKYSLGVAPANKDISICAFVKVDNGDEAVMNENGCKTLARFGNVLIADIPIRSLSLLSSDKRVKRIEAGRSNSLCLDTTSTIVGATKVLNGQNLPQAYTGKGVVMGLMDVGFDLTHPNFYDKAMQTTRIRRFWDQLSPDSLGSSLYVGADYQTAADILAYGRSHDGLIDTHGTHTLGIAAGTGCGTPYRGIASDADICLVSNAVNTDIPLIPEEQLYKYTTATDALGFKYIFDYADEMGKPCVISFSEGSTEMLDGEQELYYEVLGAMTGKGKILVASAANSGDHNTYMHKPSGVESDGVFLASRGSAYSVSALGTNAFDFRITAYERYGEQNVPRLSHTVSTASVEASNDSLLTDTLLAFGATVVCQIQAYKTALPGSPVAYDILISSETGESPKIIVSLEAVGNDADVQLFSNGLVFYKNNNNPNLSGGEKKYSVACPGASPSVICVGATSYRTTYKKVDGNFQVNDWGKEGAVAGYSSVGPTRFGLCKPDVVAPGTNVYSSMSGYYAEAVKTGGYMDCASFYTELDGKRCLWGAFTGTSQATPVVAGAIALWLEANPALSTADILDIFAATCHHACTNADGVKDNSCGYGEIDVYAGLLKVLGLDGIKEISSNNPSSASIIYRGGGIVEVAFDEFSSEPRDACIKVFSSDGSKVVERKLDFLAGSGVANIGLLPAGVYVLQLSSAVPACRGSVLVRLSE